MDRLADFRPIQVELLLLPGYWRELKREAIPVWHCDIVGESTYLLYMYVCMFTYIIMV